MIFVVYFMFALAVYLCFNVKHMVIHDYPDFDLLYFIQPGFFFAE
jgi:hypothetical protein